MPSEDVYVPLIFWKACDVLQKVQVVFFYPSHPFYWKLLLFQGFKHIVFFYLFFEQIPSYSQSDQGYSNCNIGVVRPSTSKSTQRKSGERDSFTVSLPPGSKRKQVSDLEKIKIINEAYTGMKAQQQNGKIRSENLIILAISICKAVPQLYDKPPPSSECSSEDFIYWVCSFTIILPYLHITHYILWLYHSSDLFNNLLFVISGNCT